jgi:hypothetical protein
MPKEKLKELVEELSSELKSAEQLDESDKNLLQSAVDDIHDFLESTDKDHGDVLTTFEKMEVEHPVIMGIVKKMLDTLSSMGV